MSNETYATYQNKESFSKLIFIYNFLHKKIEFSNAPLEDFFGQLTNDPEQPPFLSVVESHDTERIMNEWQACMSLKEHETRVFNCSIRSAQGINTSLNVNAWGIQPKGISTSPGVLFSAEQITKKDEELSIEDWKNKFAQLAMTLNSYKEQYSEFIDSAAHDLYAPLRKLSVFVEKLTEKLEHTQQEEVQTYISRIKRTMSGMQSMIDQLTELSRITDDMKYTSCNLNHILKGVQQDLKKTIKEKKAEIIVSDLPVIEGDKTQYCLLFRHLLENSLHFSKKDTPLRIVIKSQEIDDEEKKLFKLKENGIYYKIEISDNGLGFDKEYAKKIFKPFVRLHTKLTHSGHGLGLAICKKIISNHRGVIFAEGEENSGARFVILLSRTI
jgi:signal transduction histidine kinase